MSIINAAEHGYYDVVKDLIARGSSVNVKDSNGATALFKAACRGNENICHTLLGANASIDECVLWGSTALHAAADGGHTQCVQLLINHGANVNAQNKRGDTPLHYACFHNYTDITSYLLENKADIFLENQDSRNPYMEAVSQKCQPILNILQKHLQKPKCTIQPFATTPLSQNSLNKHSSSYSPPLPSLSSYNPVFYQNNLSYSNNNSTVRGPPTESSDIFFNEKTKTINNDNINTNPSSASFNKMAGSATHSNDLCIAGLRKELEEQKIQIHTLSEEVDAYKKEVRKLKESRLILSVQRDISREVSENMASGVSSGHNYSFDSHSSNHFTSGQSRSPVASVPRSSKFLNIEQPQFICTHNTEATSVGVTRSHKILLQICRQSTTQLETSTLKQHLISNWVQCPPTTLINEDDKVEWLQDAHYTLKDSKPLNKGNCIEGACSLIFRITHKGQELILKMLINILEMQEYGHNQGFSLTNALHHRFGAECLPSYLPLHRNIIKILHSFTGSTLDFHDFQHYCIPEEISELEFSHQTQFLVLHRYPTTLKNFLENSILDHDVFNTFFLQILYQLLSAVDFLQEHHIVHRDIKSDNIFLNSHLQPVLADFGFAQKLYADRSVDSNEDNGAGNSHEQGPLYPDSLDDIECANPLAWAPELIRWKNKIDAICLQEVTLENIYQYTDVYAIGRMFYTFFTSADQSFPEVSTSKPHYSPHELPILSILPALSAILKQLVLDIPSKRLTARQAMLRAGCLLYPPSEDDITCEGDVGSYLQAKMLSLHTVPPPNIPEESMYGEGMCSVVESICLTSDLLEAHFLSTVTAKEFWEVYQTFVLHMSNIVT